MLNLISKKKKQPLMIVITANYESEFVSVYLQLMMHASIFPSPPCKQVIIQKSVTLFCITYTVADFHNAGERGTPIMFPWKV